MMSGQSGNQDWTIACTSLNSCCYAACARNCRPADLEKPGGIEIAANGPIKARSHVVVVTCDQLEVLLGVFVHREAYQAASSRWLLSKSDRHEFDLHRDVDRIYLHMVLEDKYGFSCRLSGTIPLEDIPTSTNLERELKGAHLEARWVMCRPASRLPLASHASVQQDIRPLVVKFDYRGNVMYRDLDPCCRATQ
jgi:hypothetical protein